MIALDTNVLVHAHRKDASLHLEAFECVKRLAESPAPWAICFHSFVEFYGITSHRKVWQSPSTADQIENQISAWRESPSLRILVESPSDIGRLLELAKAARVSGPMIHDARIASCCLSNGVNELWTVDRDFTRFSKLRTRNPLLSS